MYDAFTGEVLAENRSPHGWGHHGVAIAPNRNLVLVAIERPNGEEARALVGGEGALALFDADSLEFLGSVPTGERTCDVAVFREETYAYLSVENPDSVMGSWL